MSMVEDEYQRVSQTWMNLDKTGFNPPSRRRCRHNALKMRKTSCPKSQDLCRRVYGSL